MGLGLAAAIVALTGFISLSYEIVWYRAASWAAGGAPPTFGVLLGFYLLGLAVGALLTQRLCGDDVGAGSRDHLRRLAGFVFLANAAGFLVLPGMAAAATAGSWAPGLLLIALSAGALGAVLPLVSHFGVPPDALAGARVSYLYLANILGSTVGSLLTGFVLMDALSLSEICLLLFAIGAAASAGLLIAGGGRAPWLAAIAAAGVAGLAGGGALYDGLYERLMLGTHYQDGYRFDRLLENRSGVIAITQDGKTFGGGVYDGVISVDLIDDRNMLIRPFALPAFHPAPREVLMIGMSTGAWAQVVVNLPGVEKLTIIEINPGYLEVMADYPEVASLLDDPRVEIVIDDGRRWLQRNPDRTFDAIIANTTFHWRAHASSLLSTEYMEMNRAHLKAGGVVMYNTTWSAEAIKTGLDYFPYGYRFVNCVVAGDAPIEVDVARWRAALLATRINGAPVFDLSEPTHAARLEEIVGIFDTLDQYGVMETDGPAGDLHVASRAHALSGLEEIEVITDDNMASEWASLRLR